LFHLYFIFLFYIRFILGLQKYKKFQYTTHYFKILQKNIFLLHGTIFFVALQKIFLK